MVIQEIFFNHKGGKYIYRVHNEKIKRLCVNEFEKLKNFLYLVQNDCPNQYFNNGPRGSCLKFKLVDDLYEIGGHEVSLLARHGLEINKERFEDRHSQVQTFMLENDKKTLAMEVPIWLNKDELSGYKNLFKEDGVLTGHIDILRVEDGNVWIWDYKPNAIKEKYAATQIFFYALMLSKRTGVPLEKFRCGYFDHLYAFMFKPRNELLFSLNKQRNLI